MYTVPSSIFIIVTKFGEGTFYIDVNHDCILLQVALLTGAPIVPVFTENIRSAYTSLGLGARLWRQLYERTRLPMVPIYGGLPVRLTTHVGAPIRVRREESAAQLGARVQAAMRRMVAAHQAGPRPSLATLLLDRLAGTPPRPGDKMV